MTRHVRPKCHNYLTNSDSLYGIAFSHSPLHPRRIALSTSHTNPSNRLMVVDQSAYPNDNNDYQLLAQGSLPFPATKVAWEPKRSVGNENERGELIATSGDVLRIWELSEWNGGYGLDTRSVLTNVGDKSRDEEVVSTADGKRANHQQ